MWGGKRILKKIHSACQSKEGEEESNGGNGIGGGEKKERGRSIEKGVDDMLTLECQRREWEVVGGEERIDDVNRIRRPF